MSYLCFSEDDETPIPIDVALAKYAELMGKHGLDSAEVVAWHDQHKDLPEFVTLAAALRDEAQKPLEGKIFKVNVHVQGYDMNMNVKVFAKSEQEAIQLACSKEQRYQDDDPYLLLVEVGKASSVLCTYADLIEALEHVENITSGRWRLLQRDPDDKGEGVVIKSWED